MNRLPSLDDYDVQGVRPDEAALWGDEVLWSVEARSDAPLDGFIVESL
ncbi:MAG TPA: hypothetical protein VK545_09815 [Streptomyces sp.]|nr:hypothetical protein [Streptomyces sp.]